MFGDGSLTMREFAMKEPLPLARVQDAVLTFLQDRDDAVLFGAQAVNAYVDESRNTQDVDVLSTRAEALAEEIREHLAAEFHIAVRVREVVKGVGYRVFQLRKPSNRHLVDVRQVPAFPPTQVVARIRVPTVPRLLAQKVVAYVRRRGQRKSGTDFRDLATLLLTFPQHKTGDGEVRRHLIDMGTDAAALAAWEELVASDFTEEEDGDLAY